MRQVDGTNQTKCDEEDDFFTVPMPAERQFIENYQLVEEMALQRNFRDAAKHLRVAKCLFHQAKRHQAKRGGASQPPRQMVISEILSGGQ